jgi:hypothetical protein
MIASELQPGEEIVSCLEGEADGIVMLSCGVGSAEGGGGARRPRPTGGRPA